MADRELNILALDGGGVRGLSTLYILKNIMEAIDRENPPKPCDFFDMIGGTGSGGLLAIMLGRLKMDIDQCITGYTRLCKHVFNRKKRLSLTGMGSMTKRKSKAKHDGQRVVFALKSILRELGHEDREILLQDVDLSCRVFVCVTDASTHKLVPLSTYPSKYCPTELYKGTKIWEAAAATFANHSFFDPIILGPSRRRFTDSSAQANNPIREVWIEAKNVWRLTSLESQLRCLVSIGTGLPTIKRARHSSGVFGFASAAKSAGASAADPEVETNKFIQEHSELDDDGRLYRFDVPNGLAEIELDSIAEIETIVDATQEYLAKELVYKQVRRCGKALARPGSSELSYGGR
ncbi:acyl transferase/acyl hydrolase/lysophospholipase [Aspergillus pseudoustus]|uniref:Acyl transferase/acyl hydrolase/lysophospholipase n=1 Tax=Aspergillus pseudoustus TaxID=1810923 RepID=A0ABR4L1U2_9EURO